MLVIAGGASGGWMTKLYVLVDTVVCGRRCRRSVHYDMRCRRGQSMSQVAGSSSSASFLGLGLPGSAVPARNLGSPKRLIMGE